MKAKSSELYFVELKNPNVLRKHIFEALKEILTVLQEFEKFKERRHHKLEEIQKLRALLKDTHRLFGKLRGCLPETDLKPIIMKPAPHIKEEPKPKQIVEKIKKPKHEEKAKRPMTEMEKLEAELNSIENKLKNLG